jgi:adenylylsulfate kinase
MRNGVKRSENASFAVWITGLPASGKSTVTAQLAKQLRACNVEVAVLESDMLRKAFSSQPSYDERDREYFYQSVAFIGRILTEHGISVIFDATANKRAYRESARQQIRQFMEVYVECPLETCIRRDPKGIYKKALEGEAQQVPGIQAMFEAPENPDVLIHGVKDDPEEAARRVVEALEARGFVSYGR